jgi:DNA-directed RNA polymerase subunit RPC12/RpoP
MTDSEPAWVEPRSDYLGFVCNKCGETFSIIGPLDLAEMPPDKPLHIGARGPMPATCPHCGHKHDYTVDRLIRFSR